jgi:hypothetical protein
MSPLIDRITETREYLQECERVARRVQYRMTVKLALWCAGALVTTATTARIIEQGQPWWLVTIGAVIVAAWTIAANNTARQLRAIRTTRDRFGHAADCLPDDELLDFLRNLTTDDEPPDMPMPTGPSPVSVIVDDNPNPGDAPR